MDRDFALEIENILKSSLSDEEKKLKIMQYHENDIAEVYEALEPDEREILNKILGDETIAEIITYVEDVPEIFEEMTPEHAADIIELMDADDAIDILEELDEEDKNEIVSLMEDEAREDIEAITQYDEDQIGSRMTNNYITILNTDTVKSAMKKMVSQAAENDNISNIFVVYPDDRFYGVLELRDLIIARDGTKLDSIIKRNYPFFMADEDVEDCIERLKDYALDSYPILDKENKLIGVLTADDVVEAVDDEMSEDYAKLAGLTDEEDEDASIWHSVKKRIPWLVILLVLGLVQSFTMTGFESVVAALPIIVFFQTLVLDMAGNSGTQSLAVTIRLLSKDEEGKGKLIKTVFKELGVGLLNGLILSVLAFGFVLLYLFIFKKSVTDGGSFNWPDTLKASTIVGVALMTAMSVSSAIGSLVPIIFMKMHVDPAVASGPFITTINDVTAMLIYYGLAWAMFQTFIH